MPSATENHDVSPVLDLLQFDTIYHEHPRATPPPWHGLPQPACTHRASTPPARTSTHAGSFQMQHARRDDSKRTSASAKVRLCTTLFEVSTQLLARICGAVPATTRRDPADLLRAACASAYRRSRRSAAEREDRGR